MASVSSPVPQDPTSAPKVSLTSISQDWVVRLLAS